MKNYCYSTYLIHTKILVSNSYCGSVFFFFFLQMLCKNPDDRISLLDIMHHPWILEHYQPLLDKRDKGLKKAVEIFVAE